MVGRWLGPMPRRKRPGATWLTAMACWIMAIGWREKVTAIDVPSWICSVCVPATASVVRLSAPRPPAVSHTEATPAWSARRMSATVSGRLEPCTCMPAIRSAMRRLLPAHLSGVYRAAGRFALLLRGPFQKAGVIWAGLAGASPRATDHRLRKAPLLAAELLEGV